LTQVKGGPSYAAGIDSWKRKCFSIMPADQTSQSRLVVPAVLALGRVIVRRLGRTVISD
jgi:hypothetical protein